MVVITKYKTTALIELAHKSSKLIVCATREEAHRIHERAQSIGYVIHLPITYREFLGGGYYGKNIESLLVDDIDRLLQYIAKGTRVSAFTIDERLLPCMMK